MHSTFWWGYQVGPFLFQGYVIKSIVALVATCFGMAALTFIFEWMRYLQAKVRQKEIMLRSKQLKSVCPTENTVLLDEPSTSAAERNPVQPNIRLLDRGLFYGADFALWFFMQNLGYIIMLCVMVYNAWIFIAAILGGALGYFIFGQMFMKINMQNCQIMRETYCMEACNEAETEAAHGDGESTPVLTNVPSTRQCDHHNEIVRVHDECESSR